jgi:hypothetical protein
LYKKASSSWLVTRKVKVNKEKWVVAVDDPGFPWPGHTILWKASICMDFRISADLNLVAWSFG